MTSDLNLQVYQVNFQPVCYCFICIFLMMNMKIYNMHAQPWTRKQPRKCMNVIARNWLQGCLHIPMRAMLTFGLHSKKPNQALFNYPVHLKRFALKGNLLGTIFPDPSPMTCSTHPIPLRSIHPVVLNLQIIFAIYFVPQLRDDLEDVQGLHEALNDRKRVVRSTPGG